MEVLCYYGAIDELLDVREDIRSHRYDAFEYRYFVPLEQAVWEMVSSAQTPIERRIYTGLPAFDQAMRGLRPAELMSVNAYAHQGKTVFATHVMHHNRSKRMVLFTMDETRPLVLSKLVSLVHGVSAEEVEERLFAEDEDVERLVQSTVVDYFPRLAVFDDIHTLDAMSWALDECRTYWGDREQLVILDYLTLLQGSGEDVHARFNAVKSWGKEVKAPLMVLHQSSRTKGSDGQKVKIDSGLEGGEQQSMFVVGVRRKRSLYEALVGELELKLANATKNWEQIGHQLGDARHEAQRHKDTITFNLVKNKRPPSKLVEDLDLFLDPQTGKVHVDLTFPPERGKSVDDAMAMRAWNKRQQQMSLESEEEEF